MVAGPAAGGSTGGNGSTDGNSGLGILVILLIAIVVVSCLVYLVLTHNSKGANDRGAFDRLSTAPPAKSVARDSTGPRPFASPEPSRLTLEDRNSLPMIYPDLVMNNAHTRLAIPAEPLLEKEFEIDILGLRCVPLLTATLNSRGGRRVVQIALHSVGTLLAKVTSGMQVLGADGAHFGTLSKDTKDSKEEQYLLRALGGRVILTIRCDPDVNEVQMVSAYAGRTTERAMVVRRPAGNLPAEHYEVTVSPQVDAVLVLACFLGLKVFGMPRGSQAEVMRSGSLFG